MSSRGKPDTDTIRHLHHHDDACDDDALEQVRALELAGLAQARVLEAELLELARELGLPQREIHLFFH
jgi:hypothetical protein